MLDDGCMGVQIHQAAGDILQVIESGNHRRRYHLRKAPDRLNLDSQVAMLACSCYHFVLLEAFVGAKGPLRLVRMYSDDQTKKHK
ncbi:hypothetical protein Q31b_39520 [Novipirellula aureliae]|uniref:Uncharacterized protein n=1 Tax=Novipirellula aureliae TaxID=2527966 RepID=A0A5C6DRN5_9BACT|nr:hypothetical protein Q31b_39520 [Novipirellula aureliae]